MQGSDDWPRQFRRIYDYQFLFCFKGRGEIQIEQKVFYLRRGSLVVIEPNKAHRYCRYKDNPCDCYWVHLDFFERDDYEWPLNFYNNTEDYLSLFSSGLSHTEHIREKIDLNYYLGFEQYKEVSDPDIFETCFAEIHNAYIGAGRAWQYKSLAAFYTLLNILNSENKSSIYQLDTKSLRNVNLMKDFIRQNYFRKITVPEITAVTCFNSDYAARVFKRLVGMPISEYLLEFRLRKAKRLLMDLDLKISDIAIMCGFQHESYFSSVIRSKENMPPKQLREHILNNIYQNEDDR